MRATFFLLIHLSIFAFAELKAQLVDPIDLPPDPGISWEIAEPVAPLLSQISRPLPPENATKRLIRRDSLLNADGELVRLTENDMDGRWDMIESYEPGNLNVAEYRYAERHPNGEISRVEIAPDPFREDVIWLRQVYDFDTAGRTIFGYSEFETEEQWKEWEYSVGSDWIGYREHRHESNHPRKKAFVWNKSTDYILRRNRKFPENTMREYQGKYRDPANKLELHFTQHPWSELVRQSFIVTQFNTQGLPVSKTSFFVDEEAELLSPLYKDGEPDWEVLGALGLSKSGHDPSAAGFSPVTRWRYEYKDGLLVKKDRGNVRFSAADDYTRYSYDGKGQLRHTVQRDTVFDEENEACHQIFFYDAHGQITDFVVAVGSPAILPPDWDWNAGSMDKLQSMFAVPPEVFLHFQLEYNAEGRVKTVSRRLYDEMELWEMQEDRYRKDGQIGEIRYSDDDLPDYRAEYRYDDRGLLQEVKEFRGDSKSESLYHHYQYWE